MQQPQTSSLLSRQYSPAPPIALVPCRFLPVLGSYSSLPLLAGAPGGDDAAASDLIPASGAAAVASASAATGIFPNPEEAALLPLRADPAAAAEAFNAAAEEASAAFKGKLAQRYFERAAEAEAAAEQDSVE